MDIKICRKCFEEKNVDEFRNDRSRKDGKYPYCKQCSRGYRRERFNANPKTRESERKRLKKYNASQKGKNRAKTYKLNNPHTVEKAYRNRRKSGKAAEYSKLKYETDPLFKLKHNIRSRLRQALRLASVDKKISTMCLLGCSWSMFKKHIESQFLESMDWCNSDEWDLDHIIPLSAFDLSNDKELRLATHYTNIQPLWSKENNVKRDRLIYDHIKKVPWGFDFISSKNLNFNEIESF